MAVYTEVTDEGLLTFLGRYDLGALLSCKGIAEGVENSNFLLSMEKGHFILTLYEKRTNAEDLPFFINLMQHLAAKGLNCPLPVRNRAGEALGTLSGRPACIVTFLDGIWIKQPQPQHCTAVGAALAQLHLAGADFSMVRSNALSVSGWPPLAAMAGARVDDVSSGLQGFIAQELAYLQENWPQHLPKGIIHADLFPDNVFFLGNRLSGLIDFYFACTDALAYDLAICLNAWCFETDGSFNITKGQGMLAAYQKVRPLSAAEITALPVLCRGSALRFMLTRLVDWLNVPSGAMVKPKDPLEYYRKLRFHQAIDNAREYGLDL
jgi:homoserine kinase type II